MKTRAKRERENRASSTRALGIYRAHCQIQAARVYAFPRRFKDQDPYPTTLTLDFGAKWVHLETSGDHPTWLGTPAQARALANALNYAADAVEGVTW